MAWEKLFIVHSATWFYRRFRVFLFWFKTAENGLKTLEKAVTEKEWETVSETAHKMAAPCKHLKAEELYKKLKMLENISETNPGENKIAELFNAVKKETTEVIGFLKQFLTNWELKQTWFFNKKKWLSSTINLKENRLNFPKDGR